MKSAIFAGVFALLSSTAMSEQVRVDVVKQPDIGWTIHRLNLTQSSQGTVVTGRVNTAVSTHRATAGHIDLAAYTADGKRIADTAAHYSPALISPKTQRKGGARFSATLPKDLPPGTVIKIAFHRNDVSLTSHQPTHAGSVAQ